MTFFSSVDVSNTQGLPSPPLVQIEYMVVLFDNDEKNAKLSLRQTEILAKLGSIVDGISSECAEEYVRLLARTPILI